MAIMKYYDEATSTWVELDAANGDTVDGLHFRINGGRLQYSSDGSIWSNAGTDTSDATAIASDILAGKTVYVNDVKITGTMVDRAGDTAASSLARSGTTIRLRATQGYRDGTNDYVTHTDANDVAGNIKSGVTIRGLAGECVEATGNAVVGDVLSGKTFSKAGSAGLTGTIPSKSAATYTPSQSTQTIAAGQYLSGAQTISAVSFDASKVLTGTTIAGKAGTMPNNGSQAATLNITGSTKPTKSIPAGYTTGGTVTAQIDASQAGNIKQNVNLAGCVGTYEGVSIINNLGSFVEFYDSYDLNFFNFPPITGDIVSGSFKSASFTVLQDYPTFTAFRLTVYATRRKVTNLYQTSFDISVYDNTAGVFLINTGGTFSLDETYREITTNLALSKFIKNHSCVVKVTTWSGNATNYGVLNSVKFCFTGYTPLKLYYDKSQFSIK